ncbi:unnamed protein product [Brassicogethes aeneus]|uniref:Ig-like domain-containing protein n=1 Tax=Brassicogethes aeneus TaxID=1431903 RepID=A0A9P0AQC0_BRAAE|nr:unnamed protein product [Brassicogethes aeneus]
MKITLLAILFAVFLTVSAKPQNNDPSVLTGEEEYGLLDDPTQADADTYDDNYSDNSDDSDNADDSVIEEKTPQILTKANEIIATPGQEVVFPCEIKDLGNYVRVWNKDSSNVLYQGGIQLNRNENIKLTSDESLHIRNVSEKDVGNYTCEILITNNKKISVTHILRLPTAPKIISLKAENDRTTFSKGETLKLTCLTSGLPKPVISWHKETNRLEITGDTLIIENLKAKDGGLYRCLADNKNPSPAHQSIEIEVETEPIVTIEKYAVNTDKNKDIELKCTVHGVPAPVTNWQKDGMNLVSTEHHALKNKGKHHMLIINNVQDDDFGSYTCTAKNSVGRVFKNITIVKEPAVLHGIKSERMGKDFLLTFKVESNQPITEHDLQFKKKGESEWKSVKPEVTPADKDNIYTIKQTLQNLEGGTYETRVRSHNTHGWSQWSNIAEFTHAAKHHNKHKTKHQKEKEPKEYTPENPAQEILHKESSVGASTTGGSSTISSSILLTSIALLSIVYSKK